MSSSASTSYSSRLSRTRTKLVISSLSFFLVLQLTVREVKRRYQSSSTSSSSLSRSNTRTRTHSNIFSSDKLITGVTSNHKVSKGRSQSLGTIQKMTTMINQRSNFKSSISPSSKTRKSYTCWRFDGEAFKLVIV
jgi:hypothetical protein